MAIEIEVLSKIWESKEGKKNTTLVQGIELPKLMKKKDQINAVSICHCNKKSFFSSYLERYTWRSWVERPWWEERRHRTYRSSWTSWYSRTGWITRASRPSRISWQTCEQYSSFSSTFFQISVCSMNVAMHNVSVIFCDPDQNKVITEDKWTDNSLWIFRKLTKISGIFKLTYIEVSPINFCFKVIVFHKIVVPVSVILKVLETKRKHMFTDLVCISGEVSFWWTLEKALWRHIKT